MRGGKSSFPIAHQFGPIQEASKQSHEAAAPDATEQASGRVLPTPPSAEGPSGACVHVQVSKRAWETHQKRLAGMPSAPSTLLLHMVRTAVWHPTFLPRSSISNVGVECCLVQAQLTRACI